MATLSELETRLTALEHINAIKEVQARYWLSVDRQRLDDVRDCFVETGAVIDMEGIQPCNDREDFIQRLKANGGKTGFLSLHAGQNPVIRLTGEAEAEGRWDMIFLAVDTADRLTYQLTGEYNNRYVLRNGRWYISVQRFRQTALLLHRIGEDNRPSVLTFGLPEANAFDK